MTPPTTLRTTTAAIVAVCCALAAAALAHVLLAGPFSAGGLVFDRLNAVLVALVAGVAAVTAAFSTRYLQDDPRLGRFLALLGLTAAGTVAFAAAGSLVVLVAGWLVASAGFLGLLGHHRATPGGGRALRSTARAFALGDLALVGAAALIVAAAGNADLRDPAAAAAELAGSAAAAPVALLLVVAALARSAQLPLQHWLSATVAAPTPVSALLHAGLVNAGGILLVKLGPVVGLSELAPYLLFLAGAATVAYAGAAMLARPDVKGALAHSTTAQMGFMLVQIALGAAAAAIVHIVGHALYKAALFLGSGSAIGARRRAAAAPHGRPVPRAARIAAALGLPLVALAGAIAALGGIDAIGGAGTAVLLCFAWASGAHAVDGWLRSGPPRALRTAVIASALSAGGYVALLAGAKAFLAPALPAAAAVDPWLSAPLVAAVALLTALRIVAPAPGTVGATAYAWALDAGRTRWPAGRARPRGARVPLAGAGRVAGATS